jgi:succinate dehydrogenase flavin-adding protein (antitoxin of CptAB toxin-antitoxin module)
MFHFMSTQMKFRRRLMWRGWRGMWNDDWIPDDLAVYPRCRLCRLDYEDGEEFIAGAQTSNPFEVHPFPTSC